MMLLLEKHNWKKAAGEKSPDGQKASPSRPILRSTLITQGWPNSQTSILTSSSRASHTLVRDFTQLDNMEIQLVYYITMHHQITHLDIREVQYSNVLPR